ncbi:MAG: hydrogenase maturation nickel metallochaperone HypA [Planctomycetales bacterium]|nr:hydrogenase maturation nickel metallochaperone HypA [Planctomycetales bacterium]
MHELSIAISIVDAACQEAVLHGGGAVSAVHIRLGPLSGVVKDALLSAYELARADSQLADSELVIEETQLMLYCDGCGKTTPAQSLQSLTCSLCQAPAAKVVGGRELEITALEMES